MKKRTIGLFFLTILALVLYLVLDILIAAGTFKKINPHFEGTIEKIKLPVAGPEDIVVDQITGIAFIACDDRRQNQTFPGTIPGAILTINLNDSSRKIRNVTPDGLTEFYPHGISLLKTDENKIILFAISHRISKPKHVVERFEWRNDSLIHLETIFDETLMSSPNDLAATGERSFYVTNDHYYPEGGLGRTLEDYFRRPISYVNYFDGKVFRKVAEGIAYSNGIQISKDGKRVFVASVTGKKIHIYDREPDHNLSKVKEIDVDTGADNIELDSDGNLIIGCHPQLLKFVAHAKNPINFSPSQILWINEKDFSVNEIFLNDGKDYSGATVAAPFGDQLVIGSVFEPSILILKKK